MLRTFYINIPFKIVVTNLKMRRKTSGLKFVPANERIITSTLSPSFLDKTFNNQDASPSHILKNILLHNKDPIFNKSQLKEGSLITNS